VPFETINAYRDHGNPESRLGLNTKQARLVLELLPKLGIKIDTVTQQLEDEGVQKFVEPFDMLHKAITRKSSLSF
jgi:transaldolase/transaldolase/glucose-6-phosphate isomerase